MKRYFLVIISTLVLTFSGLANTYAAFPSEINGQPLPSLAPMLEKTIPGVVNIATQGTVKVRDPFFDDPIFRHFFNMPNRPRERKTQSLGSGVIIDADKGYVLTNNHVIAEADKITVTLTDGRNLEAELIGTDPESDVAVIQIPSKDLIALPTADSSKLRVGDFVIAIGNPFGLGQTVTSGIVSAMGRSGLGIEGYEDFIQTDASINPGNSGGALVNLRGELVGLNTAILSRSGGNIGIGFAIPIDMVQQIMNQLIEHGEVKRGRLGVHIQNLTPELARAFNIDNGKGAVVSRVIEGSAADKAKLKSGDIIISVNGSEIDNASNLRHAIGMLRVGQRVKIELLRNGKKKTAFVVIAEPKATRVEAEKLHRHLQGASLGEIDENHPLAGKANGVLVYDVERGSAAWSAGLRKGDIITSINKRKVENMEELREAVKRNGKSLLLNVRRGNGAMFLFIQ